MLPSRQQITKPQEEYNSIEKELKESYIELLKRKCDFLREKEEENTSEKGVHAGMPLLCEKFII